MSKHNFQYFWLSLITFNFDFRRKNVKERGSNSEDKGESLVEEELVNQISSSRKRNEHQVQKKSPKKENKKTNKNQQNRRAAQRKPEDRRKPSKNTKKQSLRDKFRQRIQHGKQIESDPSAFTEQGSDITINQQNTTLNEFNPHNPQNFTRRKQMTEIEMFEEQERQLEAELNSLNQYRPQINKVERVVGVQNYKHTNDFLNKMNPDYQVEDSLGYFDEKRIEESLNNLNDLILRKKHNQAIPFINSYTPMMAARPKDPAGRAVGRDDVIVGGVITNESGLFVNSKSRVGEAVNGLGRDIDDNNRAKFNNNGVVEDDDDEDEDTAFTKADQEFERRGRQEFQNEEIEDDLEDSGVVFDDKLPQVGRRDPHEFIEQNYHPEDPQIGYRNLNQGQMPQNSYRRNLALNDDNPYYKASQVVPEDSAEHIQTPQVPKKSSRIGATMNLGSRKNTENSEFNVTEGSQMSKKPSGYLALIRKQQKMKKEQQRRLHGGKGAQNSSAGINESQGEGEQVVETEGGNLKVNGGVDLKKLFLD